MEPFGVIFSFKTKNLIILDNLIPLSNGFYRKYMSLFIHFVLSLKTFKV